MNMVQPISASPPANALNDTAVLHSGQRLDCFKPSREQLRLDDLVDAMSRAEAARSASGFYSLAQRATILAEAVCGEDGPLVACHALVRYAPEAIARSLAPTFLRLPFAVFRARFEEALARALDLDWPAPAATRQTIEAIEPRLLLTELIRLCRGVDHEIVEFRRRDVRPLATGALVPLSWEKAHAKWLGTWRVMATAAHLPRTPAWGGL